METIKREFDEFLNDLVKSYPKATLSRLTPDTIEEIGTKSRDFFKKAKNKIDELVAENDTINKKQFQNEVAEILVKYHGMLMKGHL